MTFETRALLTIVGVLGVLAVAGSSRLGAQVVGIAAVLGLWAIPFLKRKYALGALAIFVPILLPFLIFRLAKPDSIWAERFYPPEKFRRACERFPDHVPPSLGSEAD